MIKKINNKYVFENKKFNCTFDFIQEIEPDIYHDKEKFIVGVKEYQKKGYNNYVKPLRDYIIDKNKYEASKIVKLFCEFRLDNENYREIPGVYIYELNNKTIAYVGSTSDFNERIKGYGRITPRNIFVGGQSTNCNVNRKIKENSKKTIIKLYFCKEKNYKLLEKLVINEANNPDNKVEFDLWNKKLK